MIRAAVVRSLCAPRIRPAGFASVSSGLPWICGMTATPVSKPESPRASLGKTSRAMPIITRGFPCCWLRAAHQSVTTWASLNTWARPTSTTTAFSSRNTATRTTATLMASLKPRRKTTPRPAIKARVIATSWPCRKSGANGFSMACALASAAESVMVIMKSVAAKPRSARTNSLPPHRGRSRSSIAMEPSPRGLSEATRRYTGRAPRSVTATSTTVAKRRDHSGGKRGNGGLVAKGGEVVDAGKAHDFPPGLGCVVRLWLAVGPLPFAGSFGHALQQPAPSADGACV